MALGVHIPLRGEAQPGLDMAGVKAGAMEESVSVTPCSAEVGFLQIWSAVVTLVHAPGRGIPLIHAVVGRAPSEIGCHANSFGGVELLC